MKQTGETGNQLTQTILATAGELFDLPTDKISVIEGGNANQAFGLTKGEEGYVIKVIEPTEEFDGLAFLSILEWMNFLTKHQAAVAAPQLSINDKLIEEIVIDDNKFLITVQKRADGVRGEILSLEDWSGTLLCRLGQAVGKIHDCVLEYDPDEGSVTYRAWNKSGNNFNVNRTVLDELPGVKAAWERVDAYVSTLPHYSECYGLVHADLHLGNLLVEKSCNLITLVDFDDCVKGWYVMDIALLLMDMLVVYSPKDYQAFTHFFLENFLTGYMAEKSLGSFWANQIPVFMRLAEMAIYSQFYKNYDPATGNGWLGKFMPGRRERIESELPFVDADFVGIATKVRERIKK